MTEPFRDAINTLATRHTIPVHDHDGHLIGHREQDALLVQLHRARASNINRNASAAQHHARSPLNTQAVELYEAIQRRIRGWAKNAGLNPQGHAPHDLLTAWYAHVYLDIDEQPYLQTLRGWTRAIGDLLDPPHRFDIDDPCPACQAHILEIPDPDDTTRQIRVRALQGLERDPDIHTITCRNCQTTWNGIDAALELHDEIQTRAAEQVTA